MDRIARETAVRTHNGGRLIDVTDAMPFDDSSVGPIHRASAVGAIPQCCALRITDCPPMALAKACLRRVARSDATWTGSWLLLRQPIEDSWMDKLRDLAAEITSKSLARRKMAGTEIP